MPQLTPSSPTLPLASTTNFDFALPAMTSGAVRFRPLVLLASVGCMNVLPLPLPAEPLVVR